MIGLQAVVNSTVGLLGVLDYGRYDEVSMTTRTKQYVEMFSKRPASRSLQDASDALVLGFLKTG